MENEQIIMALKTMMVYLASLNIKNSIILDKQLITWFKQRKYNFEIFSQGYNNGNIYYMADKIILNITNVGQAFIALTEPTKLNFYLQKNGQIFKGEFTLDKEKENYGIQVAELIENSDKQINFTLNKDGFFKAMIATINYEENLVIKPEEYLIRYNYEGKDQKHQISYEAFVAGMVPCMLKTPASFITKQRMQFNDSCFIDKKYYQNSNVSFITLMQKLYPDFQQPIKQINKECQNWLGNLLSLTYPHDEKENLRELLGIEKGKVLINGYNLTEFMQKEKAKNLILERRKKK